MEDVRPCGCVGWRAGHESSERIQDAEAARAAARTRAAWTTERNQNGAAEKAEAKRTGEHERNTGVRRADTRSYDGLPLNDRRNGSTGIGAVDGTPTGCLLCTRLASISFACLRFTLTIFFVARFSAAAR